MAGLDAMDAGEAKPSGGVEGSEGGEGGEGGEEGWGGEGGGGAVPDSLRGTKLDNLISHLRDKSAHSKSVVFTNFNGFMDLAAKRLKAEGIAFVLIQGSSSQAQRMKALNSFVSDPTVEANTAHDSNRGGGRASGKDGARGAL